jgi:hypothetical protein
MAMVLAMMVLTDCSTAVKVDDPLAELELTGTPPVRHEAAMAVLDADPRSPEYLAALHRMIWKPGYAVASREAALVRLAAADLDELKRTIRQRLPQMSSGMWAWLKRLCEEVANRNWLDLTPALVSSWSRPLNDSKATEADRPEWQALSRMHGQDRVTEVVFETFLTGNRIADQGLRRRCWELLHRLGERERLVALLSQTGDADPNDLMLADLRAAATDWGIVPFNREEILWIRKLREPDRAGFWSQATEALGKLPAARRAALELRDVPVVCSATEHEPHLLERSQAELLEVVRGHLRGQRRHHHASNYDAFGRGSSERLDDQVEKLTWGDVLAMCIAIRAAGVLELAAHLFDYAQRDQDDTTAEYGGVIRLDERGRFEVMEFPPTFRRHDREFISSQAMMDAGYTSLFHFHLHAQTWRNADYAGPSPGDRIYADNTRTNCLVFTAVSRDVLNMDYYRHGGVLVDLGEVRRPRSLTMQDVRGGFIPRGGAPTIENVHRPDPADHARSNSGAVAR